MRPWALLLVPLVTLAASPAPASDAVQLLRCQEVISRAAGRLLRERTAAVASCLEDALHCPSALAGTEPLPSDACLASAAHTCAARLARARASEVLVDQAALRCTAPAPWGMAVQVDALVDDDGLSLDALADWCPAASTAEPSPADASRCQRRALACSVDAAMILVMPRAAEMLARLGLDADEIGGCAATPGCGDGIEDDDEECDDGAANSDSVPDACRTTCVTSWCGDRVVDGDEECDDGNGIPGDGCEPDCALTSDAGGGCGDGIEDDDEECDDGAANSDTAPDACRTTCRAASCGDGVVDGDEDCDDGNTLAGDGCEDDCTRTHATAGLCGNGILDPDEGCDPPLDGLCDTGCQLVLPDVPSVLALPRPAPLPTGDVRACQAAVLRGGARVLARGRALVAQCVGLADACLAIPDDADGPRRERCLARADRTCAAAAAARDRVRQRSALRASVRCEAAGIGAAGLRDAARGIGLDGANCEAEASAGRLIECAYGAVQCVAEKAVAMTVPRAPDLFDELMLDADSVFPCLVGDE